MTPEDQHSMARTISPKELSVPGTSLPNEIKTADATCDFTIEQRNTAAPTAHTKIPGYDIA